MSDDTQTTKDSKSYTRLKNYRHTNRLNGKCAECGKPSEKYRCAECSAKKNERARRDREYYKKYGICPVCKQVGIGPDESMCPECLAKEYTYQMSKRNSSEESHAKYSEQHRIWAQMKYEEDKANGICTRCRKRKADGGYTTCGVCRAKNRGRKLAKEANKVSKREYREKNGLCFFCDEPRKPGYKLCERHYQMNVDKANSQRAKDARKNLIKNCILYK